eukprot:2954765-Rhodomonas_salina.10
MSGADIGAVVVPGSTLSSAALPSTRLGPVAAGIGLRACHARSGANVAYGAIVLQVCYAMSGTDIAYGVVGLRACYALSGTELACGGPRMRRLARVRRSTTLRYAPTSPYAMSGTGIAHGGPSLCDVYGVDVASAWH